MVKSRKNWYRVSTLDGEMTLWQADHCKDKEEAIRRIDAANKETMERGSAPEKYAIVYIEEIIYVCDASFGDAEGLFRKKETTEYLVEHYPKEES